MKNNEANSHGTPQKEGPTGEVAQGTEPMTHFRRDLVPLEEYAARQGLSSDTIEQQGQLGVVQIRKYRGKKFVVDVPPEQLAGYETEEPDAADDGRRATTKPRQTTASKLFTAGLAAVIMVVIVSVSWLYMDARQKLDDLNAEYIVLQNRYTDLTASDRNVKALQEELSVSRAEFNRIQDRIAASKTELEKIQADLAKARRDLDAIASQLSAIQGQLSLSKVEIESIQNTLTDSGNELDRVHSQNEKTD